MVSTWIGAVVGIVALVIGIKVLASPRFDKEYGKGFKLTAGIGMIVIGLMLSVGASFCFTVRKMALERRKRWNRKRVADSRESSPCTTCRATKSLSTRGS